MEGDGVGGVDRADLELLGCGADDVEDEGRVGRVEQLDLEQASAEHLRAKSTRGTRQSRD